jgi:hypothetical protein
VDNTGPHADGLTKFLCLLIDHMSVSAAAGKAAPRQQGLLGRLDLSRLDISNIPTAWVGNVLNWLW